MKQLLLLLFIILLVSIKSIAAIATFQQDRGKVSILAIGNPSALKIKGEGSGPVGSIDLSSLELKGELEFNLDSLDTGMKLRNEHMKKKYLQTDNYPKAKLKISKISFNGQDLAKDFELSNAPFEGVLNLHGVEKPILGTVSLDKKSSTLNIKANFKINMKDYAIEIPSFAGITVTEVVNVDVDTKATVQ